MFSVLIGIHVLICIALMLVVLLQSGKGAGLASAFGGAGGGDTVFGGRGAATLLARATTALAILFMVSSATLAWLSAHRGPATSAIEREIQRGQEIPAAETGIPAVAPSLELEQVEPEGEEGQ
ncbi:hypothetical protein AMJ39_05390 [candidate division TA06 bacterium DG_24]|uniref:Protein-export membrane protein SecG n=3 Tax=Bacteria division TA06 TaxID=1156500 RepID=A0A0S8JKM0_UNCT6|nr:MAG: hypothetical protein AMJ39_05390 [candidate division TA06 bacterium DG_24]KPK68028.1 MAG: hypothetical protein AMJ82_09290 [candidate division TA06 bacterium SM23_40]KPL09131.1 MAG: hypothetical protein AMJ71_07230 [candidate division TA06 bacterium SM1_40]